MRTVIAQLPAIGESADKVFTTDRAIVMLDGASAFLPQTVAPSAYADCLGRALAEQLTLNTDGDLREILAASITTVVDEFHLRPGRSPSSTVTIVRATEEGHLEILLLGDNIVLLPDEQMLTDNRIDQLNLKQRATYRWRLANGFGYDDDHRALLRELQAQQAEQRNRAGGYWIAEADPDAAAHALIARVPARTAVLATDGAYNTLDHLGLVDWAALTAASAGELARLLDLCYQWEAQVDPSGRLLPRSKRHDDKAIAVLHLAELE